ncbi:MAG TPA: hypothetical protein VGN83_17535 [Falsiroseomonas sp.]|jgi:hypothetical protein|nr:hypothetical protein [Falsiroseomonas sp.]
MRHIPTAAILLAAFLLPAAADAQAPRSGPNAPAVGSQIPPGQPGRNADERSGATGTQSTDHIRGATPAPGLGTSGVQVPGAGRQPPPDHRVLGGPPVPGAARPERSEGIVTNRDVIPPDIGARVRPEAPTTGTGRR